MLLQRKHPDGGVQEGDTMDIPEWKEKVLECVHAHNGATFVDIMQDLGAATQGEIPFIHPRCKNVVFWTCLDDSLVMALRHLLRENTIVFRKTSPLVYAMDGYTLYMPVADEEKDYSFPHWLPVSLYPAGAP